MIITKSSTKFRVTEYSLCIHIDMVVRTPSSNLKLRTSLYSVTPDLALFKAIFYLNAQ